MVMLERASEQVPEEARMAHCIVGNDHVRAAKLARRIKHCVQVVYI